MRVAIEDFQLFGVGEKRSVRAVELRFSDKHMKPAVIVFYEAGLPHLLQRVLNHGGQQDNNGVEYRLQTAFIFFCSAPFFHPGHPLIDARAPRERRISVYLPSRTMELLTRLKIFPTGSASTLCVLWEIERFRRPF